MRSFQDTYNLGKAPDQPASCPSLREIFEIQGLHKAKSNHPRGAKGYYHFVCWLLEREKPNEKAIEKTISIGKGEKKVWVWPYATRLIVGAMKFLHLSRDDQRYIVAAREDRVFWRVDDMDYFRQVYDETMLWRALDSQGKAEHLAKAKAKFSKKA